VTGHVRGDVRKRAAFSQPHWDPAVCELLEAARVDAVAAITAERDDWREKAITGEREAFGRGVAWATSDDDEALRLRAEKAEAEVAALKEALDEHRAHYVSHEDHAALREQIDRVKALADQWTSGPPSKNLIDPVRRWCAGDLRAALAVPAGDAERGEP